MNKPRENLTLLRMLARSFGIATSYINYRDKRADVPEKVLCDLITAISSVEVTPAASVSDLRRLYEKVRAEKIEKSLPPTVVAWNGTFPRLWCWLDVAAKSATLRLQPEEGGEYLEKQVVVEGGSRRRRVNGTEYYRAQINWDSPIPYGYYIFKLGPETGGDAESLLISAPVQMAHVSPRWGAFAPAYALRVKETQGIGGYRELLEAARFLKKQGAELLGTLPLLPGVYEDQPTETSPYSPVSRLFWNEIYLDLQHLPGPYEADPAVPQNLEWETVDYAAVYSYKKAIILKASKVFFETYPEGDDAFQDYLSKNTHLKDYADFRARKHPPEEYEATAKFHLYAQYACHLQLSEIRQEVEQGHAATLYLDYTVGVHPKGFDAIRLSDLFLKKYQVGAPPDKTFTQGQVWGFEPLHPRKLEESRYRYLRDCFHHYFQYSKIMRIDHIMGLYRLYCVPDGLDSTHGTYVYYNLNAQLGVLCLEAWRHGANVVGEDLGIVPEKIREAMERHNIFRMWIGQNDIGANLKESFAAIKPPMIAALNTHDMFPFKAYLESRDLDVLHKMKIISNQEFPVFKKERHGKVAGLKKASNPFLTAVKGMAASEAQMVMINLEDLWEEIAPQNIPGTTEEYPNWSKRYPRMVEEWSSLPLFRQAVEILNRYRMARP